MPSYKVMVDDNFHYMDESEGYEYGKFEALEAAVAACKQIVDSNLEHMRGQGIGPEKLFEAYCLGGEDPFVVALHGSDNGSFSAWDYARGQCEALARAADLEPAKAGSEGSVEPDRGN